MVITNEQAEKIKESLLEQLSNFPEDKREQIKGQVESMTPKQIENFVEQNNLLHLGAKGNCIFCTIVEGETPSFKIAENEKNIAVLEINPLSKGHTLIVPKEHSDKIFSSTQEFGELVALRIKERFKPNEIQINQKNIMGHSILELTPIYGNETKRKPADPTELKKIQQEIKEPLKEQIEKIEKNEEKVEEEIFKAKPRIPK
jgi:histidine triad (HIT) family protein